MPRLAATTLVPAALTSLLVIGAASPTRAERVAVGLSASAVDTEVVPGLRGHGVLARLGVAPRLSVEGEVSRRARGDAPGNALYVGPAWTARQVAARVRLDLGAGGRLRPHLLAGVAAEQWQAPGDPVQHRYTLTELGGGLDLRLTPGLYAGVDLRAQQRAYQGWSGASPLTYVPTSPMGSGEQDDVAGRVTLTAGF